MLTASIGKCENFHDGISRQVTTIVVTPVRIIDIAARDGGIAKRIIWGCSKYIWCRNGQCEFSQQSRDDRRERFIEDKKEEVA